MKSDVKQMEESVKDLAKESITETQEMHVNLRSMPTMKYKEGKSIRGNTHVRLKNEQERKRPD